CWVTRSCGSLLGALRLLVCVASAPGPRPLALVTREHPEVSEHVSERRRLLRELRPTLDLRQGEHKDPLHAPVLVSIPRMPAVGRRVRIPLPPRLSKRRGLIHQSNDLELRRREDARDRVEIERRPRREEDDSSPRALHHVAHDLLTFYG